MSNVQKLCYPAGVMRHNIKQIDKLRSQCEGKVIQYMPRGESTVREGVRRFQIKSISHLYKHKQSGNTLMQCVVYDRDDHGKRKHRSLNVELFTVES